MRLKRSYFFFKQWLSQIYLFKIRTLSVNFDLLFKRNVALIFKMKIEWLLELRALKSVEAVLLLLDALSMTGFISCTSFIDHSESFGSYLTPSGNNLVFISVCCFPLLIKSNTLLQ